LSPQLPRSVPFIDGLLTLTAIGGSRFSIRLAERWRRRGTPGGKRVLIIGAGDAGRMIAREMQNNPQLGLDPLGFIDDDPAKQGMQIQGLPVLGDRQSLPELVRDYKTSQAIIAMPTAPGKTIRHFVELCEEAGIQAKTIPGIYELLSGRVSVSQIHNVEIEDLLRREPVHIETEEVERMLRGKRVLVTGAGGSIGSEICRQALQLYTEPGRSDGAAELILLGHGENSIFQIARELERQGDKETRGQGDRRQGDRETISPSPPHLVTPSPPSIVPVIADIRDLSRLQSIFEKHRPHLVFHAAAHKHVPLMECNVQEAVSNPVLSPSK
jgi:FlaA1/EpsC-like NDP-sugar epimerase